MRLLELSPNVVRPEEVNAFLTSRHYLGPTTRGLAWNDEFGCMVLGNPTSRRLPQQRWMEISRWCLIGTKNGGSRQWSKVRKWLLRSLPEVTTVVSYSDPAQGHTGSLYKACGFYWAPTWHRLKPPPSGNGSWANGKAQGVKDRWVFDLRPDEHRAQILSVKA